MSLKWKLIWAGIGLILAFWLINDPASLAYVVKMVFVGIWTIIKSLFIFFSTLAG